MSVYENNNKKVKSLVKHLVNVMPNHTSIRICCKNMLIDINM